MSNVIQFPRRPGKPVAAPTPAVAPNPVSAVGVPAVPETMTRPQNPGQAPQPNRRSAWWPIRITIFIVHSLLYTLLVLLWPLLRWFGGLVIFIQFFVMLFTWTRPESNAGWVFLGCFSAYLALNYLVIFGAPRDLREARPANG